jgi:glutamate-1-semialdehyde aminotransferase
MATETARQIWERHRQTIPGGIMSLNRAISPMRVFVRAKGAHLWDHEGRRYIDYHAAFAPYLLGHGDDDVDRAVVEAIQSGVSLIGAGAAPWEGGIAERLVSMLPAVDQVQLTNSGSEAVVYALRLARAATGHDDVVIMQGGYNGWGDAVAFNLMDPGEAVRDHEPGSEYPLRPISAGIPAHVRQSVHVVEYNELPAVERVLSTGRVAAVILEPVLQNVGVVAGRRAVMELCESPDPARRVMIAGTYNAHPFIVAAAIATLDKLKSREQEIYGKLERLGQRMEHGLNGIFAQRNYPATVVRQGSAFTVYFMDHAPESWRDIARHHDAERDVAYRRALIEKGVFHFPVTTKQGSISFAHSEKDIDRTLEITEEVLRTLT